MAIEILAGLFVFGAPLFLLTEEILHRLPARARARRRAQARRLVRATAPAGRVARTA
ncbi:MAG: hypothetical protein HY616_02390 [Candidatus Rokubacteria bacterium]|nr:hypothetical protein [Candidatus Rokubacteria bacterium]